jgi:hypothetical protein
LLLSFIRAQLAIKIVIVIVIVRLINNLDF